MTRHVDAGSRAEGRSLPPFTILMVDDDSVDVRAIRRSVRKAGLDTPVVSAPDGLEALSLLRGERPDVDLSADRVIVLLDLKMPRMNGIEFLEELRRDPELCDTPVIVHTTSEAAEDRAAAAHHSVMAYVPKSTRASAAEATELVRRYLEHVRQSPEN